MVSAAVAAPVAREASAQAGPRRSIPSARSRERSPGPVSVSAVPAPIRTALYSQPPLAAHGPLGRWTFLMAVVITPVSAAEASGVANVDAREDARPRPLTDTSDRGRRSRPPGHQARAPRERRPLQHVDHPAEGYSPSTRESLLDGP